MANGRQNVLQPAPCRRMIENLVCRCQRKSEPRGALAQLRFCGDILFAAVPHHQAIEPIIVSFTELARNFVQIEIIFNGAAPSFSSVILQAR